MSWGPTSPAEVRAGVMGLLLWGLRQKVESVSEGRVWGGLASSHRISGPLSTLSDGSVRTREASPEMVWVK